MGDLFHEYEWRSIKKNLTNHPSTDYSFIVLPLKIDKEYFLMHVLIITQYFPPETGVLASRWGDFQKYLLIKNIK